MQRQTMFAPIRRHACVLFLSLTLMLSWSAVAWGHAHPKHRSPAQNATLQQPPAQVQMSFTEDLEGAFSTLTVTNAQGQTVNKSSSHVQDGHANVMIAPLKPLTSGTYTVHWHAVSRDGHTTEGSYRFHVK